MLTCWKEIAITLICAGITITMFTHVSLLMFANKYTAHKVADIFILTRWWRRMKTSHVAKAVTISSTPGQACLLSEANSMALRPIVVLIFQLVADSNAKPALTSPGARAASLAEKGSVSCTGENTEGGRGHVGLMLVWLLCSGTESFCCDDSVVRAVGLCAL